MSPIPVNVPHGGQRAYIGRGTNQRGAMVDSDDDRSLRFVPAAEESTVRRVVAVCLGLVGLLFVLGLVALLPGADRLLDALTVSLVTVLVAAATALVVGALVVLAPAVRRLVEQSLGGTDTVVQHVGASAMYLVRFVAVLVAYDGFAGAVRPLFAAFDIGGLYDLGFLALGLLVLGALVRRLYRCWAPVTELVTAYVTDALGGGQTDAAESR